MQLDVWFNAFIPKTVKGYTQTIPRGTHAGKTAVALPGVSRANPLNAFKDWDAGYLTDQRSFSDALNASVRMQSFARLSLFPHVTVLKTYPRTSGTTEIDLKTGQTLDFKKAKMKKCYFFPLKATKLKFFRDWYKLPLDDKPRGTYSSSGSRWNPWSWNSPPAGKAPAYGLYFIGSEGDPLISAAAHINYEGIFNIAVLNDKVVVEFEGYIDDFPAFECYARFNGRTKCLFTSPPPPGNTVMNLLGEANREVNGRVTFSLPMSI